MAKSDNRITKLRKDIDQLRKNYTGAFASANRVVYEGIEQLADHELSAIKTHYEEALRNLKDLRKGGAPRDLAVAQLQLLQETIDRIMSNARESLAILDGTRRQISTEIRDNLEGSGKAAKSAGKRTRKGMKTAAAKASSKAGQAGDEAVAAASQAAAGGEQTAAVARTRSAATGRSAVGKSTAKKRTRKKTVDATAAGNATRKPATKKTKAKTAASTKKSGPSRAKSTTASPKSSATGKKSPATKKTDSTTRKRKPAATAKSGNANTDIPTGNSGSEGSSNS